MFERQLWHVTKQCFTWTKLPLQHVNVNEASWIGFQTYIFRSKVPSNCRKSHFRDPNFKMGFQTYIFFSKVPSKCRKYRFRDPNFKTVSSTHAPGSPYNYHYDLPLTKIMATTVSLHACILSNNRRSVCLQKTILCEWNISIRINISVYKVIQEDGTNV